jgi:hypothetical protein
LNGGEVDRRSPSAKNLMSLLSPLLKFITHGQNTATFKVLRKVLWGEDIASYYRPQYPGESNCESKRIYL